MLFFLGPKNSISAHKSIFCYRTPDFVNGPIVGASSASNSPSALSFERGLEKIPLRNVVEKKVPGLDWIGFTVGYGVSTALRIVFRPTPFLTRLDASRSGWLFQNTIPSKVTIAKKA